MIHKAFLTGGLVLIAPGSSAQVLVGLMIAMAFFTLLLQMKPYKESEEDTLQVIATASTVMTLLIGFTLKIDHRNSVGGEEPGEYDSAMMDVMLVLLFTCVSMSGLYITMKSTPCYAVCEKHGGVRGCWRKHARRAPNAGERRGADAGGGGPRL